MKNEKLLIIVKYYPPNIMVAARRWGNLLPGLQQEGFECIVITAGNRRYCEQKGRDGEMLIQIGITNQDIDKGIVVNRLKNKKNTRKFFRAINSLIVPPFFRDSSIRIWLKERKKIIKIAQKSNYIISSYPPVGPFLLGWWLAKKLKKPWIADLRDSFESRDGKVNFVSRNINRMVEKYLLRYAKQRITVSKTLAAYLERTYKLSFKEIYNGWTNNDIIISTKKDRNINPYLYYAGSIYSHQLKAILIVLNSLKNFPDLRLKVRLLKDYTNGEFYTVINKFNKELAIELLPPTDQEIVNNEIASSIGSLVLEDISDYNELRNGTITGKLLGLLASGFPGIAVSSRNGEIRNFVNKVNGWFGVDTIENCEIAIKSLLDRNIHLSNNETLMEYNMMKQSKRLIDIINNIEKQQRVN